MRITHTRTARRVPLRSRPRRWWRRIRARRRPRPAIFEQPYLLVGGHACFQTLVAGCRLGLFDFLSAQPGRSVEEIAAGIEIPEQSTRVLLLACASLGLVDRDARTGTYRTSVWAERLAVGGRPGNIHATLEAYHALLYQPFFRLTESLREGRNVGLSCLPGEGGTIYERLTGHPELERVFHAWMREISGLGIPDEVVEALGDRRHLVDVGGGDASNAILLAGRCPDLRVTIFDLPSVCALAEERIAEAGLLDRIAVVPGDFLHDPLPDGVDAILFAHIFNIYSEATNAGLVRKSAERLSPGGKLLVFNLVSRDDQTGPLSAAVLSLYFLAIATGEGMVYPPRSYESWFRDAGFSALEIRTSGGRGVFVGTR